MGAYLSFREGGDSVGDQDGEVVGGSQSAILRRQLVAAEVFDLFGGRADPHVRKVEPHSVVRLVRLSLPVAALRPAGPTVVGTIDLSVADCK